MSRSEQAKKLLVAIHDRGLSVVMTDNGPVLRGDKERVTKELREAVGKLRSEIIELVEPPKPKVKTTAWVEWSDDKEHAMPLKDWQRMEDDGVLMDYFDWRPPRETKVVHLPEGENHPAWRKF